MGVCMDDFVQRDHLAAHIGVAIGSCAIAEIQFASDEISVAADDIKKLGWGGWEKGNGIIINHSYDCKYVFVFVYKVCSYVCSNIFKVISYMYM